MAKKETLKRKEVVNVKRAKRPTRAQKIVISKYGLDPAEWLVLEHTEREIRLICKCDETTEIIIRRS